MKTNRKIQLSILLGILAALLWSIADMLLVGFMIQPEKYGRFVAALPEHINSDLAVLMLDGSATRLMYGVYLATFSVFLYLLSVYGIYKLLPKSKMSTLAVLALFIGYATSPVGHTGFAYIGLLAKSLQATNAEIIATQTALLKQFETLLNVHWIVSISCSALGWLLILVSSLRKQFLTKTSALFNPILIAPLIAFSASFFPNSLIVVLFGCACLNISQLLFFSYLFINIKRNNNLH